MDLELFLVLLITCPFRQLFTEKVTFDLTTSHWLETSFTGLEV